MKRAYIIAIAISLLVSAINSTQAKSKPYKGEITIIPQRIEHKGDSVYISIKFDFNGVKVKTLHSISLVPYIVSEKELHQLPTVMVKGYSNYLTSQREVKLMSKGERKMYDFDAPYTIIRGYGRKHTKEVNYTQVLPYEEWMDGSQIEIREDQCGCGTAPTLLASRVIGQLPKKAIDQLPPKRLLLQDLINPSFAYASQTDSSSRIRTIAGESFLDFVVSQIDIYPNYMNNPKELKKITDLLAEVKADTTILARSISVIGYASPEGNYAFNQYLSKSRATALVKYLVRQFSYPEEMYKVVYGGENWLGLKEMVSTREMPAKEEYLTLLNSYPNNPNESESNRLKQQLRGVGNGTSYPYMVNNFCPYLRKAICKIEFEIKEWGRPSEDPNRINAAIAALASGDYEQAAARLQQVQNTINAEYLNTLGLLRIVQTDYEAAQELFKKASSLGLKQADTNLEELHKLIEKEKKNITETSIN